MRYTTVHNQLHAGAVPCLRPPTPFCYRSVSPSVPVLMKLLFLPFTRQVDNAKVLHYVGAGIAFPTSMLFVCLQSALTYRLAKTQGEYSVAHLRLCMTLLAFVALVLSILSSHKQMAAFEPVKCFTTRRGEHCQPLMYSSPWFSMSNLHFFLR